jgi:hypothetical protein
LLQPTTFETILEVFPLAFVKQIYISDIHRLRYAAHRHRPGKKIQRGNTRAVIFSIYDAS